MLFWPETSFYKTLLLPEGNILFWYASLCNGENDKMKHIYSSVFDFYDQNIQALCVTPSYDVYNMALYAYFWTVVVSGQIPVRNKSKES